MGLLLYYKWGYVSYKQYYVKAKNISLIYVHPLENPINSLSVTNHKWFEIKIIDNNYYNLIISG